MRINIIPPSMLINTHITNEHFFIPRVFDRVLLLQREEVLISALNIPESYTIGNGHIKFFYVRLKWLFNRYQELFYEMGERSLDPDVEKFDYVMGLRNFIDSQWMGDYSPTPEDYYLNFTQLILNTRIGSVETQVKAMNDAILYKIAKGRA